jgi:hypothetical protein
MSNGGIAQLRLRWKARLAELALPDAPDVEELRTHIAEHTGRPIALVPVNTGSGPRGVLVRTDSVDYIAYERETTPTHQRHIVVHELAHIACGHESWIDPRELVRMLLPHLRSDVVSSVLCRSGFSDDEEREAEVFASLVFERSHSTTAPSPSEEAVARFEAYLSGVLLHP